MTRQVGRLATHPSPLPVSNNRRTGRHTLKEKDFAVSEEILQNSCEILEL
jgi:hypothetical protein